jgi:hypothetical protein
LGGEHNRGKSEVVPFLTIQKAIDCSNSGDMILVKDGTYPQIIVPMSKVPLYIK